MQQSGLSKEDWPKQVKKMGICEEVQLGKA